KHVVLSVTSETLANLGGGATIMAARAFKQAAAVVADAGGSPIPVPWAVSEVVSDPSSLFDDATDGFKIPAGVSFAEVTFNAGFAVLPTGVPTVVVATITHSAGGPSTASAMVEDSVPGMTN